MIPPLTRARLLQSSLRRRRFRTVALVLTVAGVTGGLSLLGCLEKGIRRSVEVGAERFGADLIVIPRGGRAATEGALIVGRPTQLTLPAACLATIRQLPGVAVASPQLYLKTLTDARCCPGEFFLIGYDPETDFTLRPWLARGGRRVDAHDAIVGDRVTLRVGDETTFFGTKFRIAGRLEPTGVGIDSTVFIPLAGVRDLVHHSRERAEETLTIRDDEISVVLVKAAAGTPPPAVAEAIANALEGVEVVLAPQVIGAALGDLTRVLRLLLLFGGLLWLVLLPLLGVTFSMAVAERRRDIGLHRALGATAEFVFRLILAEAAFVTGVGAVGGVVGALVLLIAFGRTLADSLGTAYLWPGTGWVVGRVALLVGAALLTGAVAAWLPARAAAMRDPYECIRQGEA